MDNEFATAVGEWQNFQALAGASAATLLGLLFVSASLHPQLFFKNAHPELLSIGEKSLGLLMLVIIISLVFLIPHVTPTGMALTLGSAAILALYSSWQQVIILQQLVREWGWRFVVRRILLPVVGYVLLLGISISVYDGETHWLHWLGAIQITFLFTATLNAWDLLAHVGRSE